MQTMAEPAVLDLQPLEDVYGDDRAGIVELVEMVVGEEADALALLRAAVAAQDLGALRDAAHGIRGAAANVGALAVSHAALAIEARARSGEWNDVSGLLHELDLALVSARTELARYRAANA